MKLIPFNQFIESFKLIRKKPGLFSLNLLADFAFLVVFSAVYLFFIIGIMDRLQSLTSVVTVDMLQNIRPGENIFSMLSQFSVVKLQLGIIVSLLFYFVIALFVTWIVIQSISWWLGFRMNCIKARFFDHFASFSLFSLLWWALFTAVLYGFFRVSFHNIIYQKLSQTSVAVVTILLIAIISYFEIASYSTYGRIKDMIKKTFTVTTKKAHLLLLTYAIITAMIAIVYAICWGVFKLNTVAGFIAGVILSTAVITFSRIYLTGVIRKL